MKPAAEVVNAARLSRAAIQNADEIIQIQTRRRFGVVWVAEAELQDTLRSLDPSDWVRGMVDQWP